MYHADDIVLQGDIYERARRALEQGKQAQEHVDIAMGTYAPQIVQLAGHDPASLLTAARLFSPYADGIDLNLGCPQTRAQRGHYGGYLLGRKDWPLVKQLVAALAHGCDRPISTKVRLCDYAPDTYELATQLAHAGSSLITVHARHVAPNRRRAGPAKLEHVRAVVEALQAQGLHASQPGGSTLVLSNGNVRTWDDIVANLAYTQADGVMVGEPLLMQPDLFVSSVEPAKRPTARVLPTYLRLCEKYNVDTSLPFIKQHTQYILRSWAPGRETRIVQDQLRAAESVAAMRDVLR